MSGDGYLVTISAGGADRSVSVTSFIDAVHVMEREATAGRRVAISSDGEVIAWNDRRSSRPHAAPSSGTTAEPGPVGDQPGVPAVSKLEAVSRLGRLNGREPERLGPGSKERKSVLVNLAAALGLAVDTKASKPDLGAEIARALRTSWDRSCYSTGSTLTLEGLNRLLLAAERAWTSQGRLETERRGFGSVEAEAGAILSVIRDSLPEHMIGRECVQEMREAEFSHWAQDEWAGFYFEFVAVPACERELGGAPALYGNTRFDYSLDSVWDLKWHGSADQDAPLNDAAAVESCLSARGLGFVVLSGDTDYDDGGFREWFRQERAAAGKRPAARAHEASYVRRSKVSFTPRRLEAFHLPHRRALDSALADRSLVLRAQGRQASGAHRKPKYHMHLGRARESLRVAVLHLA